MPGWKKLRSDKTSRTSAGNKMFNSCRHLHYRSLFSTFDSQAELWKKPGSGKMGLKRKLCDNLSSNNEKVIKKICPKLGNFALFFLGTAGHYTWSHFCLCKWPLYLLSHNNCFSPSGFSAVMKTNSSSSNSGASGVIQLPQSLINAWSFLVPLQDNTVVWTSLKHK